LAWDNPFGAFPAKKDDKKDKKDEKPAKEEAHKRHGSLDSKQQRLGDWDNQHPRGDQPDSRPHTSHSHRKTNEPPRPNTSHGPRPPTAPIQGLEADDNMYLGRYGPNPVGPSTTVQPLRPEPHAAPQGLPMRTAPQRSFTQPVQSNTGPVGVNGYDYNRTAQNDKHAMVGLPPPNRHQGGNHQYENDLAYGAPLSKSQTYDHPRDPRDKHAMVGLPPPIRHANNHQYDHDPGYNSTITGSHNHGQSQDGPEMPNFDAMAPSVSETLTGPKAVEVPAYAKKSYQALTVDTKPSRPAPPRATDSPLADFSFDLPRSSSALPELDHHSPSSMRQQQYSAMGQHDSGGRDRRPSDRGQGSIADVPFDYNNPPLSPPVPPQTQRGYDSRVDPRAPSRNQNQTPSQFPPRGASRPDMEGSRRPSNQGSQQDSGYWAGGDQKSIRPGLEHDKSAGPSYLNGGGEYYQQNGYDQGYGEQYSRDAHDQRQDYSRDRFNQGNDRRSPPRQGYATSGHLQGLPQRPATSSSSQPPPMRSYGDRGSSDSFRPDMPPSMNGGMDRPPPVRPGLMNTQTPQQRGPSGPQIMQQQQQQPPMRPQQQPAPQHAPQPAPQSQRTSASSDEKPKVTVAELNQMREQFKERPNDFNLGLRFAKRLVEAAKVLSDENGRADPKQVARNRERYINDAHKIVKKMVSSGSTEAMFYMADCYGSGGLGLPIDPKEAFHLYQSAAKLNHPQSAYRVAVCCELGTDQGGGTRRDPMKAIQWYKRAAILGDTPAMYKMGMILLKGLLGQQRDPRQAVSWLKRAAERADKDNPHALHELGLLYESARPEDHILRDERYAFDLFHQAAELGYKYSQYRLGSVFEYGALGCPIDQRQSIQWYSKAASQGEHQSELALSGWYLTGATEPSGETLVQVNEQEAFLWARKAASSGLAKAEFAMG
jgi:TPR repeat protein